MQYADNLKTLLLSIDKRGYKAYKILQGKTFHKGNVSLRIEHVQGDPFATPSVVQIKVPNDFPKQITLKKHVKVAIEDLILRHVFEKSKMLSSKLGSGHSGVIQIPAPSQAILERSGITMDRDSITLNIFAGFPANGRRIDARNAIKLFDNLFTLSESTLFFRNYKSEEIENRISLINKQVFLREKLKELHLVSFIADGSILPRESGISDKPLKNSAVPFAAPKSMSINITFPNGETISGMGIKEGITLIAGGGYHGKTTLLEAIHMGIYNHVEGDGREFVITDKTALKIRTEDGRSVNNVDISNFITRLPDGTDTAHFTTRDASGSTSMAAALSEAIEMKSKLLLIDEDTSATNFMIRDARMQKLIKDEPIIPLIDRLKELYSKFGMSSILVIGGAGAYLDVCDNVIVMHRYLPEDATHRAKAIAKEIPTKRDFTEIEKMKNIKERSLRINSINVLKNGREKIKANGKTSLQVGDSIIDLGKVEEITEQGQLEAIGHAIKMIKYRNKEENFYDLLLETEEYIKTHGINSLFMNSYIKPTLTEIRRFEIASALNRHRKAVFK